MAPFPQNRRIQYFRGDARTDFGFWKFGLLDSHGNPKIQNSKVGSGISTKILNFEALQENAVCGCACVLRACLQGGLRKAFRSNANHEWEKIRTFVPNM